MFADSARLQALAQVHTYLLSLDDTAKKAVAIEHVAFEKYQVTCLECCFGSKSKERAWGRKEWDAMKADDNWEWKFYRASQCYNLHLGFAWDDLYKNCIQIQIVRAMARIASKEVLNIRRQKGASESACKSA